MGDGLAVCVNRELCQTLAVENMECEQTRLEMISRLEEPLREGMVTNQAMCTLSRAKPK